MLPVRELVLLVPLSFQVENLWVEPLETHRETSPNPLALAGPHVTDSGDMMTITRMNREDGEFPATWGERKSCLARLPPGHGECLPCS